jgi:hypothetical protein
MKIAMHQHLDMIAWIVEHDRSRVRTGAAAHTPDDLLAVLGPEPALQRHRLAWRQAVDAVETYRARYPTESAHPVERDDAACTGDPARRLLGTRPIDRRAAVAYN